MSVLVFCWSLNQAFSTTTVFSISSILLPILLFQLRKTDLWSYLLLASLNSQARNILHSFVYFCQFWSCLGIHKTPKFDKLFLTNCNRIPEILEWTLSGYTKWRFNNKHLCYLGFYFSILFGKFLSGCMKRIKQQLFSQYNCWLFLSSKFPVRFTQIVINCYRIL